MHRSVATVCLSGTLEDKLPAIAAAGFDGVEIFENDLIASPWSPTEVRRRVADLGLTIDLYQPFRDFEAVPPEQLRRNLRRAERKFEVMAALGTDTMLVCSNVSAAAIDDDDLAAAQLGELAARAGDRGLRIAYEALAWGRHVFDYRHAWSIVSAADSPHLGVCLDSFHILSRDLDPTAIRTIPGEKIFFLQLADAPHLVMDVLQWSRHYRCFPGQGGFDLPAFTGHVLATGYRGPLSLEVFNDVFRRADADRIAVDALRSLLALEESLQAQLDASGLHGVDVSPQLHAPPAPPELAGYAFTEIAVDEVSGPAVRQVLRTLGFIPAGEHRSKPVQLWEQGAARILLNAGDTRVGDRLGGDAVITALGVETGDPTRSAARASQLLAPPLPRERGPAEADLSAVAAPDGTSIFFCRTGAQHPDSWLGGFGPGPTAETGGRPDGGPTVSRPSPGLTRIDHLGLAQPFDYFDEATLFYRSVLGLEPEENLEFAAPHGLVRSRALANPDGSVQMAMTVSALGTGDDVASAADAQQVAFACADILSAARAVRDLGAELLAVPGNYYDDLAARTDLDPDLLDGLREFGVFYDGGGSGEFFHFYTPLIAGRLYFEVVQRVGGYRGYGGVNAPVRIAAQRRQARGG